MKLNLSTRNLNISLNINNLPHISVDTNLKHARKLVDYESRLEQAILKNWSDKKKTKLRARVRYYRNELGLSTRDLNSISDYTVL
jgi:hypothetical protein